MEATMKVASRDSIELLLADYPELMTTAEAAKVLRMSQRSFLRLLEDREAIECVRVNRAHLVLKSSLIDFMTTDKSV